MTTKDRQAPNNGPKEGEDTEPGTPRARASRSSHWVSVVIVAAVAVVLILGFAMLRRAESKTNAVALNSAPKGVTVIAVREVQYRPERRYVGTLEPWVRAAVGPQLVSAYVDTVLVRPGAFVAKGEVLATLDCRNANATSKTVAMQARALDERQRAYAHEAARVRELLDGGFVSPNEAEQKSAQSASEQAQLLATQARLLGTTLEVADCVLRAPFDGEIAARTVDPGAFVRPGTPIVTVVDRSIVRVVADAPEIDFDVVHPGVDVRIHVMSTRQDLTGKVSRRAPAADDATRTVHFEMDVPNPSRAIPVGTTAELGIDVGSPRPAVEVPLRATSIRAGKASVFVVENGRAHARVVPVFGERDGSVYLDEALAPGTLVVTEGRALLGDGDRVAVKVEP
jgi:membrane fusion protein (multidrug efflux system)